MGGSSGSTEGCLPLSQPGGEATEQKRCARQPPSGVNVLTVTSAQESLKALLQAMAFGGLPAASDLPVTPPAALTSPECGRERDDTFPEPHCPPRPHLFGAWTMLWALPAPHSVRMCLTGLQWPLRAPLNTVFLLLSPATRGL